ncbi:Eaf1p ASCRUDRAFT_26428, partial [Ascoidea rubescens DSM 1968]
NLSNLLILLTSEIYPLTFIKSSSLSELYYYTKSLPLFNLTADPHKVLTTEAFESGLLEGKISVVHARIEELKKSGRWSLRQPEKYQDPFLFKRNVKNNYSHWDLLLSEMNWMSIDFKESRKYKIATCYFISKSIMDYWNLGKDFCCIKRKKINFLPNNQEFSNENQSIFKSLQSINALKDRQHDTLKIMGDEFKRIPIVPVSKLLVPYEENHDWFKVVLKKKSNHSINDKALDRKSFNPSKKNGLFSTKSEFLLLPLIPPKPPLARTTSLRPPSIWTPKEDKELLICAEKFQRNWNLISSCLFKRISRSRYESNIERRTPWICFERFFQLNSDKYQLSDLQGPHAQQTINWMDHINKVQSSTKRRVLSLGAGNESIQRGHRKLRWASMFDAIRKCMKKREVKPKSKNSSLKKYIQVDSIQASPTPIELSLMKYESDLRNNNAQRSFSQLSNVNQMRQMLAIQKNPAAILAQQQQQQRLNPLPRPATAPNSLPQQQAQQQLQQLQQQQLQQQLQQQQLQQQK